MFWDNYNAIQVATSDFNVVPSGSRIFDCLELIARKKYLVIEDSQAYPRLLRAEKILSAILDNTLTPDTTIDELAEEINYINPDASLEEAIDILTRSEVLIGLAGDLMIDEDSLLNFWLG